QLDDEAADGVWFLVLAFELLDQHLAVEPLARREKRPHVLVGEDAEQEVEVVPRRATQANAHGSWTAGARRASRRAPEPSATPARISPSPPSVAAVIVSPRRIAP